MTNILDCGHLPSTDAGIGTGVARDVTGKTLCYECATKWIKETAEETGKTVAYVSSDNTKIITWNGDVLGTITRRTLSGYKAWYVARLWDGKLWYGQGPSESGTYVSLKRYKNQ